MKLCKSVDDKATKKYERVCHHRPTSVGLSLMTQTISILLLFFLSISIHSGCKHENELLASTESSGSLDIVIDLESRITSRDYPSVFQAWYGIDMEEYPDETEDQRLLNAAKHDVIWEEPLSQLGENVDLVLGLEWSGTHHGLSDSFTKGSLSKAIRNKEKLQSLNPNIVTLFEIRWRDAPRSFLPENSDFWKKDENGSPVKGWLGGWEPFYMLNYENPDFQDNVARQAKKAVESGVYDGVMLDWSGHLGIIKKVREAIGDEKLIIVNIHDDIEDGEKYKEFINGSFMELNPQDDSPNAYDNLRNWENIRKALLWFDENLKYPQLNCLEVWGDRSDLARMRAATTLALTHSDGAVLYGDYNPLPTPDHLHDWYPMWDIDLGRPIGERLDREDGAYSREFDAGTVVYNPYANGPVEIEFDQPKMQHSTGQVAKVFVVADRDGDVFLNI